MILISVENDVKGKHRSSQLFLGNLQENICARCLKKNLCHMCFPVNFAKFLRTPFLQNISGRLLLKAPREEFEPMRNLNEYCEPAEYVFSAVRRILS